MMFKRVRRCLHLLHSIQPVAVYENLVQMKDFIFRARHAANADELGTCLLVAEINAVFVADLFIGEDGLPFLAILRKLHFNWRLTRAILFPRRFVYYKNASNSAGSCKNHRCPRFLFLAGMERIAPKRTFIKCEGIVRGMIPTARR